MSQQGIETENDLTPEQLVENVFIKGNCRNVSNISAVGDQIISIGQFRNGGNIINVKDGIILSTGDIALAEGPNISSESTFSLDNRSNDVDLSQLATDELFDVTGIEFDFVPLQDRVSFRYVFASEEYCEYVGSSFNDVFGFFVSGPGINGTFHNNAINVATLLGTDENVSINTVNHIKNTNFYIDNVTNLDAESCMIISDPAAQDEIEFDGYTIPLTASFKVIPCETYHIRLIIGDVGDDALDSGVFLETNSFDLGEGINVRAVVPNSDEPIAYEDCVNAQFVFSRSTYSNIDEDHTIEYSISSESEAINGVDFEEIPLTITIPAGDTFFTLPINVIEDNITEGPEKLKLELMYDCDCIDPSVGELFINEVNDITIEFEEMVVCPDQLFRITPEITGGVPPFDILWETGLVGDTLEENVTVPTQYTVMITDFCGNSSEGRAYVEIQNVPTVTLMGNYSFCEAEVGGIAVDFEGNAPWGISYSIDDVPQTPIHNIQSNPFYLSTPIEGTYRITSFTDAFCVGTVNGIAVVESTFDVVTDIHPPSCFDSSDGRINIVHIDAIPPFSIEWNIQTADDYHLENLTEDLYILNITDADGCSYEEIFDVKADPDNLTNCPPIYIPNVFSPNRDGHNDTFSISFKSSAGIENIVSLEIFNRWGELMFEQTNFRSSNTNADWNGDFNGSPLPPGVFTYKIIITLEDGKTTYLAGDVTLIR